MSLRRGSNSRPDDYKSSALPAELPRLENIILYQKKVPSEKNTNEFPELLQVGGLPKIITTLELVLPIQRFSQENRVSI